MTMPAEPSTTTPSSSGCSEGTMARLLPSLIETAGIAAVAIGAFLIDPRLALVIVGVAAIAAGNVLDAELRKARQP
jgi:hypothetical protein